MINSTFVIFGMEVGGLFMARQLRKQFPDAMIMGIGFKEDIGGHSNSLNKFYAITSAEDCQMVAEKIYNENGNEIKAFICSNPMLEMLTTRCSRVFSYFSFENNAELYFLLSNKERTAFYCRSLGINQPKVFPLRKDDIDSVQYPVVIKPVEKLTTMGVSKCVTIYNRLSLVNYLQRCYNKGVSPEMLLCQKCIEGNNKFEYGYGGYFNDGEPVVDICFHQFVQVPQGLSCYIREVSDEVLSQKIKSMVIPFVRHFKYSGIIEFDLKEDEKTKQIYVLDINPRPWRSVDMLSAKLGQSTIFRPVIKDTFVIWRHPYREMLRRANCLNVNYKECRDIANRMNHKMVFMSFDRRDLRPFVWQCRKDVNDFISRLKRKLFK